MNPIDFLEHAWPFVVSAPGAFFIYRLIVWMPNERPFLPNLPKRKKKLDPITDMCEWKRQRRSEEHLGWLDDWIRIERERAGGKTLERYDVTWQIEAANNVVDKSAKKKAKRGTAKDPYVSVAPGGHVPTGHAADEPLLDPALEARLQQKYAQQLSDRIHRDTVRIVNFAGEPITVYRD